MNHEYECRQRVNHPFTVGDYVKSKYSPELGVGKVTGKLSETNLLTEWEDGTKDKNFHWTHLELTTDRPNNAKQKVLSALKDELNRLRTERADFNREMDEKISKLMVAVNAVDDVEL